MLRIINKYKATPMTTKNIYQIANTIRDKLRIKDNFPIVEILESALHAICPSYSFEVLEDKELPNNVEASTDIVNRIIYVKNSIYEAACEDKGRARFTLAHELGHAIMHNSVTLNRATSNQKKSFEDPEWQANTFASALLIPIRDCYMLSIDSISDKYGVSFQAAQIAKDKWENNKIKG